MQDRHSPPSPPKQVWDFCFQAQFFSTFSTFKLLRSQSEKKVISDTLISSALSSYDRHTTKLLLLLVYKLYIYWSYVHAMHIDVKIEEVYLLTSDNEHNARIVMGKSSWFRSKNKCIIVPFTSNKETWSLLRI